MHRTMDAGKVTEGLALDVTTSTQAAGAAKLKVLHREAMAGMPTAADQEIRVLFAKLEPGDRTPCHSHCFPVTVYMLEGTFTLELDGRDTVTVKAGEVFIEPPHVRMTGRNLDPKAPVTMALFYVSTPGTPFSDLGFAAKQG